MNRTRRKLQTMFRRQYGKRTADYWRKDGRSVAAQSHACEALAVALKAHVAKA